MYTKWKIKTSQLDEKIEEYGKVVDWCNDNGNKYIIIEEKGYWKVVQNTFDIENLKQSIRDIRNLFLKNTDFTQLPDAPFTSEQKTQYAAYRQYLRDYTNGENWWLENPKTFDEWKS